MPPWPRGHRRRRHPRGAALRRCRRDRRAWSPSCPRSASRSPSCKQALEADPGAAAQPPGRPRQCRPRAWRCARPSTRSRRMREHGVRSTLLGSIDDFTRWALEDRSEIARDRRAGRRGDDLLLRHRELHVAELRARRREVGQAARGPRPAAAHLRRQAPGPDREEPGRRLHGGVLDPRARARRLPRHPAGAQREAATQPAAAAYADPGPDRAAHGHRHREGGRLLRPQRRDGGPGRGDGRRRRDPGQHRHRRGAGRLARTSGSSRRTPWSSRACRASTGSGRSRPR